MKKRSIITLMIVGVSLFVSVLLCGETWADGESQGGGNSSGSGSSSTCASDSPDIHEPSCGKNGGGKSWRVYKLNSKTTISNLDDNASWKIKNGGHGGAKITGSKGILEECVKGGASHIFILGLNRVVVPSGRSKLFYISFDQQKVSGDHSDKCRNNRGCYYNWNEYKQIEGKNYDKIMKEVRSAKNGRIISNASTKVLYNHEDDFDESFSKVGAFCIWDNDTTLTQTSIDENGNSLSKVSGLGNTSDTKPNDEPHTVSHGSNEGYVWVKWKENGSTSKSYSESYLRKDKTVHAVFRKRKQVKLTVRAYDGYTNGLGEFNGAASSTVYEGKTATVKTKFGIPSGYVLKSGDPRCSVDGASVSCATQMSSDNITIKIYYSKMVGLTAYACDLSNNNAKMNGGNPISGATVWMGDSASVNSAGFNPVGYTWKGWSGACSGMDRACTINPLLGDKIACAQYLRDEFGARSYAENTSYGSDVADTGYVEVDALANKDTDCETDGCKIGFGVFLKRLNGDGNTDFSTDAKPSKDSPYKPSTNGEQVGGTEYQTIKPGEQACRQIQFKPYGVNSDEAYKTVKSCMNAKITYFDARIKVSGAIEKDTDWQGSDGGNKKYTYYAPNCTYGCKVSFNHQMRKVNSIGSVDYTISKESNLTDSGAGSRSIPSNPRLAAGKFDGKASTNSGETIKDDNNLVLYPGVKVCEKITFKPNNASSTSNSITVEACVYANGNAQPPDPGDPGNPGDPGSPEPPNGEFTGGNAFVNIKVRNKSVADYNNYQREVYAKPGSIDPNSGAERPGDDVSFRASYNPILQYTYYLIPDKIKIASGSEISNNGKNMLGNLFNQHRGSIGEWKNGFSILDSKRNVLQGQTYNYKAGMFTRQSPDPNDRRVGPSDVGTAIEEIAETSHDNNTQTTPGQVSFAESANSTQIGNINIQPRNRTASVYVPYNYINTVEMDIPEDYVYYVGENGNARFVIHTKPRRNNTTDGTYATRVDDAKWKLRVSFNGSDYETAPVDLKGVDGILNDNGKLRGDDETKNIPFVVPDISAGSEICLSAAVWPADSGDEKNYSDKAGSKQWSDWSIPACFKIAKRPSVQAWGGNIFSGGSLASGLSVKKHLHEYNTYAVEKLADTFVFGSWGELGIISRGSVRGFASGSTLGYVSNDSSGNLSPIPYKYRLDLAPNTKDNIKADHPGGSKVSDYCKLSLMTIANDECSSGTASGTGYKDATDGVSIDKDALEGLAKNTINQQEIPENRINLTNATNEVLYSSEGDVEVQGGTLLKHAFKIVSSKGGNITISGDIKIDEAETFEVFSHTPKAVIYAEKTIFIGCNVTRIDALLVAKEVVTCNNLGDGNSMDSKIKKRINDEANSNQLIINGAVVANRLYANRTYGAAKGANSIVPAEIINFDPILYLWGGVAGEKDNDENNNNKKLINGDIEMTFVHDIAPRY